MANGNRNFGRGALLKIESPILVSGHGRKAATVLHGGQAKPLNIFLELGAAMLKLRY